MKCVITGLRSVELGVTDLERAALFYENVWGLRLVSSMGSTRFLRATSSEHHVLSITQVDTAHIIGITLATVDTDSVDALCATMAGGGIHTERGPGALPASAGGGYGVTLLGPEGLRVTISCEVESLTGELIDHTKPYKLTHVVLNSLDVKKQMEFFCGLLGFRISDSTSRMEFIRCTADHHSIALAHGDGLSLNHAAFEMENIDSLMYGAGRLIEHGYEVEWGLGRHGPGNNVFSYFIDPDGFVIEYTTEMQQIDEGVYQPHGVQYWANFPKRPCRWGVARKPSSRLMESMSGKNLARIKAMDWDK